MQRSQPVPGVYASLDDLVRLQHRASGFSFLPRQPIHSLLAGNHASRLRGRGLNFEEIRRYQPGDDIRQIDWKVTARTRKTHSRVYTEERERSVLFVADQRMSMFFGSARSMKSVTAAEAAALGAWRVLAQKDRVGAIVFDDTGMEEIRPQRSRNNVLRILGALVEYNGRLRLQAGIQRNPSMFNEALRRVTRLATHDFLVCVITDASGHNEETEKLVERISQHNDVLFVFVFDPLEAALPDAGPVVVSDGVRQMEIDTGSKSLREKFSGSFTETRLLGRNFLIHREIPILPLSTAEDVPAQVRRQLGAAR